MCQQGRLLQESDPATERHHELGSFLFTIHAEVADLLVRKRETRRHRSLQVLTECLVDFASPACQTG